MLRKILIPWALGHSDSKTEVSSMSDGDFFGK